MSDVTIVTGIWDLGRDRAGAGFERAFTHYTARFAELLAADAPMMIFGDESLRQFVLDARGARPTDFRVRPASYFREHFDFYAQVQEIRANPAWLGLAGWLPGSPQASMALYNPMVMSKLFMLNDAAIWNPFGTHHVAWIDGGITHTVDPGYFTHHEVLSKVESLLDSFFFVSFPYPGGNEIHGFERAGMRQYCGQDPDFVCRGGFFGGHVECLSEVNEHYYGLLSATLQDGYMGTEESIFTIMACEEPSLYDRFTLREEDAGLLGPFFEHLKHAPMPRPRVRPRPRRSQREADVTAAAAAATVSGYVVTFNAPDQLEAVLASWAAGFEFDCLHVIDNSTDPCARQRNAEIIARVGAVPLSHPRGNAGICGARQFAAEHFATTPYDYCVFIEDDMFLNDATQTGMCTNGFRRHVPNLRKLLLTIMAREGYDFLKLSFTEVYGDNKTQFSWYNVPATVRAQHWPHKTKLPRRGLDPDAPPTRFATIGAVDGVSYIDGEVYYCNWPHIVSQAGNRRMFLDTVYAHPYEQTWMSHMYQLTVRDALRPAVLLASPVTHNRFSYYDAALRREN